MSAETDQMELDFLKLRARAVDLYIERHKEWDVMRGGDLYVMPKKRFKTDPAETLLRYATADDVHHLILKYEEAHRNNVKRTKPMVAESKIG